MTLPPIIERELRVTARRGGTYWSRMGAAAMAGAIFLWVMGAQLTTSHPAAAGLFTFRQ